MTPLPNIAWIWMLSWRQGKDCGHRVPRWPPAGSFPLGCLQWGFWGRPNAHLHPLGC